MTIREPMALLCACATALSLVLQPAAAPSLPDVWIAAAATNIFEDDGVPRPAGKLLIDLAMMPGETEHRQVVLRLPSSTTAPVVGVTLAFAPLVGSTSAGARTIPPSALSWRQQGFVNCSQFFYPTIRPTPGMFPDPLWNPEDGDARLWPGVTASFWVSLDLPPDTASGQFTSSVVVSAGGVSGTSHTAQVLARVPLRVQVWPIVLPPLASGRFTAVMSWIDASDFTSARNLSKLLAPAKYEQTAGRQAYWEWMCDHRMPPNKLYVAPSFNLRTAEGAQSLQLLTNATVNGSLSKSCGRRGGARWISAGNVELLAGHRLPNYTSALIDKALNTMAPMIDEATRLGVQDRIFVYGFDETPPENIEALRQLFGAVKRRWPKLRTVATLDWSEFDVEVKLSLPLDVWVEEPNAMRVDPAHKRFWNQSGWNSSSAMSRADIETWTAAGREVWMYHCCCYALESCLNSFVEWPASMNRVMPWLAISTGATGWLYFAVNEWLNFYVGPCSKEMPHCSQWSSHPEVATRSPPDTAHTRFSPQGSGFANGDGLYFYPGPSSPLSSIRWEALRDGLEDAELILAAIASGIDREKILPIVRTVISSPADRDLRPETLEAARRKIARMMIDKQRPPPPRV